MRYRFEPWHRIESQYERLCAAHYRKRCGCWLQKRRIEDECAGTAIVKYIGEFDWRQAGRYGDEIDAGSLSGPSGNEEIEPVTDEKRDGVAANDSANVETLSQCQRPLIELAIGQSAAVLRDDGIAIRRDGSNCTWVADHLTTSLLKWLVSLMLRT
ncbi:hypothetical protein IL54_1972 [Sphingobium sp. ba1]|nr:hypothetical protein IL54_1972 [Sphingobium sp. ba1]